ncbi:hypothetical protein KY290_010218 [Solanum tuberosum]|uniref:Ubiquitin-like protease family profile domain-containing protein n=1 Tax=Solanum tuberosum TaxID=4113 RepID=A0ABQ7VX61_SOLTU|nr:hypothetical protein KY289_010606 [Solanum tuberosum]KAH0773081.1 hypothetical protein KY290_010218 [Solanum tuberosum]
MKQKQKKKINDYCSSITFKPKGKEKKKEKDEEEKEQEKEEEEKEKEKEQEKEKVKKKAKEKEKKVKVVNCDVKQQYPFEGFNIDGEGPTELMSSFSQWINGRFYKHHAKKRDKDDYYLANCSDLEFKQLDIVVTFPKKKDWFYVVSQPNKNTLVAASVQHADVILYYLQKKLKQQSHSKYRYTTTNCFFKTYIDNDSVVPEYENKIIGTIKGFGIPGGLLWHLTDEVYVLANCNGEFHWVLAVVVLKERCTKNKSHPFEVRHVTGIAQQAGNSLNCGHFVVAYTEFLSDGLQVPSYGISSETLRMRYASLLWNCGILKARSGYVSNNEDPQRPRPKKVKLDENVVVTTIN